MPLRLFIPLPGPFVYVAGGRSKPRKPTRRIAGVTPGAAVVVVLALASLIYGVAHVWWIGLIVGVVVLVVAGLALFNGTPGHRTDFARALWQTARRRVGR